MSGYFDRLLARAAAHMPAGGAFDLPDADVIAPPVEDGERTDGVTPPMPARSHTSPLPPAQPSVGSSPSSAPAFPRRQESGVTKDTVPIPAVPPPQEHPLGHPHAASPPPEPHRPTAVVTPEGIAAASLASPLSITGRPNLPPAAPHHQSTPPKPAPLRSASHAAPLATSRHIVPLPTPADTVVHIAIGRIDLVVTPPAPAASSQAPAPTAPAPQSLQAYLAQRAGAR